MTFVYACSEKEQFSEDKTVPGTFESCENLPQLLTYFSETFVLDGLLRMLKAVVSNGGTCFPSCEVTPSALYRLSASVSPEQKEISVDLLAFPEPTSAALCRR